MFPLQMKLQINNNRASTGKLQIMFDVQNLNEGGGTDENQYY